MKSLILLVPMLSGVIYHLAQKKIRADISPFILFSIVYTMSMIVMALAAALGPSKVQPQVFNLSSTDYKWLFLLSLSAVGIELGYLLAYRSGLPLSHSALISNVGVAVILLLTGIVFFKETLTGLQILGIVLSLVGIYLAKG